MYVRFDTGPEEKPGVLIPLSAGEKGTDETVDLMRQLVRKSLMDPATKAAAVMAAKAVSPNDVNGYVKAVWQAVREKIRYVPDYHGQEELTSPAIHSRRILNGGQSWGDCDDFSMLGAAWLISLGVPARFEVVASPKNGGAYDHVRVAGLTRNGWVPLETTMMKVPFGMQARTLRQKIFSI